MKILAKAGRDDLATVYIAENNRGSRIEFVESVQPPVPRDKKWVLIVSSLFGCPVKCRFCDAGGCYSGKLSEEDLFFQIDYMIKNRFQDEKISVERLKIQFARMGEPAYNNAVLDVLKKLPQKYNIPIIMPSVSTIAPSGRESFFDELIDIKNKLYFGKFQMQFSLHTTDQPHRDWLIPVKKWDFPEIAAFGDRFFVKGDRKITLNFALAENNPIDTEVLRNYFDPEKFLIKITPLNPTGTAKENGLESYIRPERHSYPVLNELESAGYDYILSIGEWEENKIGSNCGQYITNFLEKETELEEGYTYTLQRV